LSIGWRDTAEFTQSTVGHTFQACPAAEGIEGAAAEDEFRSMGLEEQRNQITGPW
jgi:hypothetical protein